MIFREETFPYHSTSSKSQPISLPLPILTDDSDTLVSSPLVSSDSSRIPTHDLFRTQSSVPPPLHPDQPNPIRSLVFIPTPPGSLDSPHSITSYCVSLGSSLISRKIKKQATVSGSFAKAEYRSIAAAVPELLSISYVLRDLDVFVPSPFLFGVTTTLPFTSQPTLPFMSAPTILTSTVIWCMTSTSLGISLLHMFLVPLNLQTSLPSLFLLSTSFVFCPRWTCPSVQSIPYMWCKQSRGALIDTLCRGRLED
ncbi:UNVERIFIED_CONTAM: hypothetical protein Sradi_6419500 [Sesamum radiatum]|uniref:Uncharacterized protein n=1 Tax=Sesamum radiatum TaxID=300843 RepID=A0AAW2K3S8_SESRA